MTQVKLFIATKPRRCSECDRLIRPGQHALIAIQHEDGRRRAARIAHAYGGCVIAELTAIKERSRAG